MLTVIGGATSAAATFTTMASDSVNIDGGAVDGTVIGANTSAAGTFSTLTSASADINGGAVDGNYHWCGSISGWYIHYNDF